MAPQAAAASPPTSSTMRSPFSRTNFAASSETRGKSSPTNARQIAASGSADQAEGADRYFATLPAKRTKAQSAFAVLQADNLKTDAMRWGPSCSSRIASDKRTYLSDRAASEAPAEKKRESVETPMSRRGGSDKVGSANIKIFPQCGPADGETDSVNSRLTCQLLSERKTWGALSVTSPRQGSALQPEYTPATSRAPATGMACKGRST